MLEHSQCGPLLVQVDKDTGYRTKSILCMPVLGNKSQVIAVVQLLNKNKGTFTQQDEYLAKYACNLAGMHLRTTEKRWARSMHHYELGIVEKTFEYIAKFYEVVLTALKIPAGHVMCECSEDESACMDEPRWNERRDQLIGF